MLTRMETTTETTYTSPRRKLVKFFERSRDKWKAKARAAKTVLKRLGNRVRRLERSNEAYQQHIKALQEHLAEWQAKQTETERELEELKKKNRLTSAGR
jgi:chromosome segregation ATPase